MLGQVLTATKVAPARCVLQFPLVEAIRVAKDTVFPVQYPIPGCRTSFQNLSSTMDEIEIILQKRRPCQASIVSHV
jgi:hypothetical protein